MSRTDRINHFCRGRVLIGLVAGFVLTTVIAIVFMKSSWGYQVSDVYFLHVRTRVFVVCQPTCNFAKKDELVQTKREIEAILMEKEGAREEAASFKQQVEAKEILLKKLQGLSHKYVLCLVASYEMLFYPRRMFGFYS